MSGRALKKRGILPRMTADTEAAADDNDEQAGEVLLNIDDPSDEEGGESDENEADDNAATGDFVMDNERDDVEYGRTELEEESDEDEDESEEEGSDEEEESDEDEDDAEEPSDKDEATQETDEPAAGEKPTKREKREKKFVEMSLKQMRQERRQREAAEQEEEGPLEGEQDDDNDEDEDSELYDSDDDADINRIGDVPLEWYDNFDHIGYTSEGEKVMKTLKASEVDALLAKADDPDHWKKIKDMKNQREITLTDTDIEVIRRIRAGKYPNPSFDPDDYYIPPMDYPDKIHPMRRDHPPKARFLPSKWEAKKIHRLVKLIREGKLRPPPPPEPEMYDIWGRNITQETDTPKGRVRGPPPMPAPKMPLPGHAESYNPPEEYFVTEEEKAQIEEDGDVGTVAQVKPRDGRQICLRRVPGYKKLILERFERCLDLYLCPRAIKQRMNIDPEALLPKLSSPADLRPFPLAVSVSYDGHSGMVRCASLSPCGQWVLTGGEDCTLRIWELKSGRAFQCITFKRKVTAASWNPRSSTDLPIVAVATEECLYLLTPTLPTYTITPASPPDAPSLPTEELMSMSAKAEEVLKLRKGEMADGEAGGEEDAEGSDGEGEGKAGEKREIKWEEVPRRSVLGKHGVRLKIIHEAVIHQLQWHQKGHYLAVVCPLSPAPSSQCVLHSITTQVSRRPFRKSKGGQIQRVSFHPSKPWFFAATRTAVRVYDLKSQQLLKTLVSGAKWISSMHVHRSGDHVVVGTYDRRLIWFDLDLSNKPYKVLRYHDRAVRQVALHGRYPLMASASDDGCVHLLQAKVFSDLMQNPLIIPLKKLQGGHTVRDDLGVLDAMWHPTQPWLLTAGADNSVLLWT